MTKLCPRTTMNLRKPPQERKTPKRIEREMGYPDIRFKADENSIGIAEMGESHWPPTFRGRDEVEALRDYCNAWLEYHDEQQESNE